MTVELSLVVPVFNEEAVLDALLARALAACIATGLRHEVLVVDDHSTDATPSKLRAAGPPVRALSLPENRGQWGATRAGLQAALGARIAVMDGDLQDPPELLPQLVAALDADPGVGVAFATKRRRDDPGWFRLGRAGYRAAQVAVGAGARVPSGAGSFCAMRRSVALRAAQVDLSDANLAAVLAALRVRCATVDFDRHARQDGASRVGPAGLAREALGSLWLLSPLGRRWLSARGLL